MNVPFATLFTAIQARLTEKVPEIRWIDQDLGQLEQERPPVSYPCALLDFTDWSFEDNGYSTQMATGAVHIRLAFQAWSNTNNVTAPMWKDKGLAYYDLEWKVFKALHAWKPEVSIAPNPHYGHLMRTSVNTEDRDDNMRVRILTFSCHFQDNGAEPVYTKMKIKPLEILDEAPEE